MIEASGVRKSWEMELSRADCSFSVASSKLALRASSASNTRSIATAAWLANASSSWRCSGVNRIAGLAGLTPNTRPRAVQ